MSAQVRDIGRTQRLVLQLLAGGPATARELASDRSELTKRAAWHALARLHDRRFVAVVGRSSYNAPRYRLTRRGWDTLLILNGNQALLAAALSRALDAEYGRVIEHETVFCVCACGARGKVYGSQETGVPVEWLRLGRDTAMCTRCREEVFPTREDPACDRCSAPLVRRSGESSHHWLRRRFCSVRCQAQFREGSDETGRHSGACAHCGRSVQRLYHGLAKAWVCRYCYGKARGEHPSKRYFEGLRDVALERDDHTCQRCGARDRLHVHHRDGDHTHNELSNLETLCHSCHMSAHWNDEHLAPRRRRAHRDAMRREHERRRQARHTEGQAA